MIEVPKLSCVPGSVYRQGKFKFKPLDFVVESEFLESRVFSADIQESALSDFIAHPTQALTYVVSGNPDDSKAKFFAAYLVHQHLKRLKHNANVHWEQLTGGYTNRLLDSQAAYSMVVLSGLATNSTQAKIEKARDLVERFTNIPVVVVVAGEDPISFAATKLHVPCHAMAYLPAKMAKAVNQVI